MNQASDNYKNFNEKRDNLKVLLVKSLNVLQTLELKGAEATLQLSLTKLSSDTFKILVLGEFKRGKSTFINALLGEKVLPAFSIPCTAVINEIKWAESQKAVLYFVDPIPVGNLPPEMAPEVRKHIESFNGVTVPPIPVPVGDLERYVVIPDPGKDQAESVAESPFARVEIFWPLELCRDGVEVIDSPGLNEHGTRTRITTEYLSKVDAVVFVMSCQALVSQSELSMINRMRDGGHEDVFFVCNRFDDVAPEERERVIKYAQDKLRGKTTFADRGIYFVSAKHALDGRVSQQNEVVEQSGLPPLEMHLSSFLARDRGRVKLMQPGRDLRKVLDRVVFEDIPAQRQMLAADMAVLEQRYAEVKPQLEDAEHKRSQIVAKVNKLRIRLKDDVRREVTMFATDVALSVPERLMTYQPKCAINFLGTDSTKNQAEHLVKELCEHLSAEVEAAQRKWQKEKMGPFLQTRFQEMGEDVRGNVDDFLKHIDQIRLHMTGETLTPEQTGYREPDGLERVLSAAGGFVLGGLGMGVVGGIIGFKALLPNLALLVVAVSVFGVLNPLALAGILLAGGAVQGWFHAGTLTKQIQGNVGRELAARLRDSSPNMAEKAAEEVFKKTEDIEKAIDSGLEKQILTIRESVDAVLAAKKQGEEKVKERIATLNALQNTIKDVQTQLNDLLFVLQPQ